MDACLPRTGEVSGRGSTGSDAPHASAGVTRPEGRWPDLRASTMGTSARGPRRDAGRPVQARAAALMGRRAQMAILIYLAAQRGGPWGHSSLL